jgi:hypothetical protein
VFSKALDVQTAVRAFLDTQIAFKKALSAFDHLKVPNSRAFCDQMKNKKSSFLTINQTFLIYRFCDIL